MPDTPNRGRRIADLQADDRPREKLLAHGVDTLSNSELLAILIATGTPQCSAIELAQNLLHQADGSLDMLGRFSLLDFKKQRGIGDAKAITLMAALELGRRRQATPSDAPVKIASSRDVVRIFGPVLRDLNHEEAWVLYLNRANLVVQKSRHAVGSSHHVTIDARQITREALDLRADGVVLCHNHPSGVPKPSREDVAMTRQLKEALALFDIRLLDHVVVAGEKWESLGGEGEGFGVMDKING